MEMATGSVGTLPRPAYDRLIPAPCIDGGGFIL
jgi:hypothetical protein